MQNFIGENFLQYFTWTASERAMSIAGDWFRLYPSQIAAVFRASGTIETVIQRVIAKQLGRCLNIMCGNHPGYGSQTGLES